MLPLIVAVLLVDTVVSENYTDVLLAQLRLAGQRLAGPETSPVFCQCEEFCSGRCFARDCAPCPAAIWKTEADCLNAGPLGGGLLCAPGTHDQPCCQPHGVVCELPGGRWCNCSEVSPLEDIFPPLESRKFVDGMCRGA